MSPAIPASRQCDRDVIASAIRQHLADAWQSHDHCMHRCDDETRNRYYLDQKGRESMAAAVCRALGLDAQVLNREAARLARSR